MEVTAATTTKRTGRKRRRSKKVTQLSAPLPEKNDAKPKDIIGQEKNKGAKKVTAIAETKGTTHNGIAEKEAKEESEKEEEGKEKEEEEEAENEEDEAANPPAKKMKIPEELKDKLSFKNKQRVLVFCTKGITHKERLLMLDLRRSGAHYFYLN